MKRRTVPIKLPMGMWAPSDTILNDELWIVGLIYNNNNSVTLQSEEINEVMKSVGFGL